MKKLGLPTKGKKDSQFVTSDGEKLMKHIDGVVVRPAVTQTDDRGTLSEIYNPAWGIHPDPLAYIYQVTIRPGKVKGWVVHHKQDDRLYFSSGTLQVVLFDARPGSKTKGLINEFFLGDNNRALVIIPKGVFHAVRNVGLTDALFVNTPTRAYDHKDPDKYRLPLKNSVIPFTF